MLQLSPFERIKLSAFLTHTIATRSLKMPGTVSCNHTLSGVSLPVPVFLAGFGFDHQWVR